MKNSELIAFSHGLHACADLTGAKFTYAVAKNLRLAKGHLADLDEAGKPSEAHNAFSKARIKLCEEHAAKDDHNKPVMIPAVPAMNGSPAVEEKYELLDYMAFEAALDTLRKSDEHKGAVEGREQQVEDFNALLDEESGFAVYTLAHEEFPKDMKAGQKAAIFDMIREEK